MNEKEKNFVDSIKNKIKKFSIPITVKEALDIASGMFVVTEYNDGTTELVDVAVERELCARSSYYFIDRYGYIHFPGVGVIPYKLYYFQKEILKDASKFKKLVFLKTRQCLTEDNFVMTNRGYISIKDVEAGDEVETLIDGKPTMVLVEDWMNQGERETVRILTNSGQEIVCTLDHEILTKEGWKEAQDLTLDDEIINHIKAEDIAIFDSNQPIGKVRKIERNSKKETVYDITTSSGDFLANGLMVHNCGISTLFSLYAFWLGNFRESENIDVVSIKQKKAQAFTKKMFPTMDRIPEFLRTKVVKKNMAEIEWENGSYMLSESASDKAGRGDSLSLLILDELAFYLSDRLTRGIVSAAQPTLTRTGGQQVLISCVVGDTYIFTNKGLQQVIDYKPEEVEPGFNMVPMFKIDGMENQQECNLFYDSGISDTIKIHTKLGYSLEGTTKHPVITYDSNRTEDRFGWSRLSEIKKGDLVTLKEGMNTFGNNVYFSGVRFNFNTSYVLGALFFLGKVDRRSYTIKIPYKKSLWRRYRAFGKLFGEKVSFTNDHAIIKSKNLVKKLDESNFFSDSIPKKILQFNKELTLGFLKGICLDNFKDGIKSNKLEAIKQIQLMGLNLGWISRRIKGMLTPAFEFSFKYQEYFIDEVVKVENFKDRQTYDFFVPKTSTFISNGIVSHNTPNGQSGAGAYYAEQVRQLQIAGDETDTDKLITIDWFEIPDLPNIHPQKGFNEDLERFIKKDYYRNEEVRKEMRAFFKPISDNPHANPFLKKQLEDLGPILYRQEIEHDFIVSGDQVFQEEILDRMKERIVEPITKDKLGKMRVNGLHIWKHPIPKRRFIMGVDSSTGTGNDYSSIQIMDVENYEQVAEYKGHIATKQLGRLVKALAKYYNEAYVVIECNSIGEAVFNEVYYHDEDPYKNLYTQKKTTKDGRSRMTGWETNVKTRQLMLNNLIDYFNVEELSKALKVYSERLYLEMLSFVWIGGRARHADGMHDDAIIALGLCLYFRNKANTIGESFLISEDGDFIGTDDIKDLDSVKLNENSFDYVSSDDDSSGDDFEDVFGMSKEDYDWLIG